MHTTTDLLQMLVIDDSLPYVEALHRDAQRHGIALVYAGSLEEGRERFEEKESAAYTGIILDVKCLKERHQQVPDNSFLSAAVRHFGSVAPHLPMVVLTGEPDQFRNLKELYEGTLRVFSKGRDEEEMLSFLREEAGKLDYVRIARSHPEAFAVVRRHLGRDGEQELTCALKELGKSDSISVKNTLVVLRRLQERVYLAMNRADESLVPSRFVAGEMNLVGCYKHLVEQGVVERYRIIDRFAELIYKISSDNGSHVPHLAPKYPPTAYTVQAVTYALLDLILWFGTVMEERRR